MEHAITVGDILFAMAGGFLGVLFLAGIWCVGVVKGWWMP